IRLDAAGRHQSGSGREGPGGRSSGRDGSLSGDRAAATARATVALARSARSRYTPAKRGTGMNGRVWLIFWILAAVAIVALFFWVGKLPPGHIRLATGAAGGAYDLTAQDIKKIVERSGVKVELVRTHGSDEKLKRLTATDKDAIDAAIMQSGDPDAQKTP